MKCPRCLNEDPAWFARGSRGWYCRRCISFGRVLMEEEMKPAVLREIREDCSEYVLQWPLTPMQEKIAAAAAEAIDHTDVLLECVCGAGKTEMTLMMIRRMLREKRRICFAIARRQVVLEVAERLQQYFPDASVVPVCQGYTAVTDGDLIVCTTHQLYRYYHVFDCLILDEPDAFPFRGDAVLHGIAKTACAGHAAYLTATPDKELKKRVKEGSLKRFVLQQRPHGKPLPVPVIRTGPALFLFVLLVRWLMRHDSHPRIVFVPSIRMASRMHRLLSLLFRCQVCTGKTADRDEVIARFRRRKHGVIVATTVLERGVTIKDADVCVWNADSGIFDEAGLIQMAGRAGRNFENPYGDVLFLCMEKSSLAHKCRRTLEEANRAVSDLRAQNGV